MMRKPLLVLMFVLFAASAVADTRTQITILNSNPEIKALYVTGGVQLAAGGRGDVWCNATIEDKNGLLDLNATVVRVFNKKHSAKDGEESVFHNYRPKLKYIDRLDTVTVNVSSLFSLTDRAIAGEWACSVTTIDSKGMSDTAQTSFRVYAESCTNGVKDEGEAYTDCGGGYCAPCLELLFDEIEVGVGREIEVPIEFISRSPEDMRVWNVISTDGVPGISVDVDYGEGTIKSKEVVGASAKIKVLRNMEPGLHVKTMLVKTASGVVSKTAVAVRVLPPPPPAIRINVQSTCVNNPTSIRVLDDETGEALGDANVGVAHSNRTVYSSLTDSFGEVSFTPGSTGVYTVMASKEGFPDKSRVLSIITCGKTTKDMMMVINNGGRVGENVVIVVRDYDGEVVSASIQVTEPGGKTYAFNADVNGKAVIPLKSAGEYRIRADAEGYNPTEKKIRVDAGKTESNEYILIAFLLTVTLFFVVDRILKRRRRY